MISSRTNGYVGSGLLSYFLCDTYDVHHCTLGLPDANGFISISSKIAVLVRDYLMHTGLVLKTVQTDWPAGFRHAEVQEFIRPPTYVFQHVILRPLNLSDPMAANPGAASLWHSGGFAVINPPDTHTLKLPINPETLLPDWPGAWPIGSKKFRLSMVSRCSTVPPGRFWDMP